MGYVEVDEIKRKDFLEKIAKIDPEKLVYSDEFGIDDNEVPAMGWAQKGHRCHDKKRAFRRIRYNGIAALNQGLLLAPFLFDGHTNTAIYETYVERVLLPVLKPGMVFVIDNARLDLSKRALFHKSKKTIDLIESVGCKVLFLPPYSPDLNPIEHYWTTVKQAIRTAALTIENFYDAAVHALEKSCRNY